MTLAAEETNNFLIPNGTFFFVLGMFLIVLSVVWLIVVKPLLATMDARDDMVRQTALDEAAAREQRAEASASEADILKEARGVATGIRDEARAEARGELNERRDAAIAASEQEVETVMARWSADGARAASTAAADSDELARELAARILRVQPSELPQRAATKGPVS